MNAYFQRLYTYNDWANRTVLSLLRQHNVQDEYVLRSFSHVINAQFIWLRRLTGQDNNYKIWDVHSFDFMEESLNRNQALWLDYLQQATPQEFARTIHYANSAGDQFQNIVLDCVAHNINHATYHRAQVAKQLRDIGVVPVNTDYITWCRKFNPGPLVPSEGV